MEDKTKELLRILKGVPGVKIITITLEGNRTFRCEMLEEKIISPKPNHAAELLLLAKLNTGMHSGGGLIIRQICKKELRPNKKQPYENVYGIFLGNDTYTVLPPHKVEQCYNTCSRCGEELPPAEGVLFKKFSIDLK